MLSKSAPTDLMVVLKFVCRGGYYPPAYYNPSVIFLRKCHLPLHKGGAFLVLALLFGVIFMIVGTGVLDGPRIKRNVIKSLPLRGNLVANSTCFQTRIFSLEKLRHTPKPPVAISI